MTKHTLGKSKTASYQFQYLGMMVVLLEATNFSDGVCLIVDGALTKTV